MQKYLLLLTILISPACVFAQELAAKVMGSQLELPSWELQNIPTGAESYFSFNSRRMILSAKLGHDKHHHTYLVDTDGKNLKQINKKGEDACSFFFPDGKRIVYTSTKDNLHLPAGHWSRPTEYPQGAELYIADVNGKELKRLTHNEYYDAEVSVSPDGKWILFTRQIKGHLDLWKMDSEGKNEVQLTHTPELQEGGAFFMPSGKEIVYRAWLKKDDAKRKKPMDLYIIGIDGKGKRRLTNDGQTNWAPYPTPDGKHILFSKILPPRNYEIYLFDLDTKKQTRLTYNDGFDGFPSISPDGKLLSFSSNRHQQGKGWGLKVYLMDVSKLKLAP